MSLPKFIKSLRNKVSKDNPGHEYMEGSLHLNNGLSYHHSYIHDGSTYAEISANKINSEKRTVLQLNSSSDENKALRLLFINENGEFQEVSNIYGEHFKPTSEDIGALSLNGGSIKDCLFIHRNNAKYKGRFDGNDIDTYMSHVRLEDGSMSLLGISCEDDQTALTPRTLRLKFYNASTNQWQDVKIYGEHFKPTPADIGAFPNNNIVHNVDYNNYCTTSGFYNLFGNCPNNPYGSGNTNTHFYLEIHVHSSNLWVRQTAYDVRTNRIFQRSLLDGVWSGWTENVVVNDVVGNYGDGWLLINKWYDTNFGNHNVGFASGQANGDVSKISINDFGMWWQKFTQSTNTWETYKLYHWGNIQKGSGTPPSTLEENGIYIKY